MLTRKYMHLFRCDYLGQTTIADTCRGARLAMEAKLMIMPKQWVLH